jgi:heavy metal sensor kinase
MGLSIRWRLTLWNTAVLAAVLLGFAALVYGLLARALYGQVDRALLAEFAELGRGGPSAGDARRWLEHWIAEAKEHENVFCVVYGEGGAVYARTEELPAVAVPPSPAGGAGGPRIRGVTLHPLGRQRALEGGLRLGGQEFTVVLLAPLEEADQELGRLLGALLLAVPAALALAAASGYLLARHSLAPVDQLRRSTEEVSAARLDRRLPVPNAHDELGRMAQTINAMIARLERSFAEVRRFTADASHELRTPLAAIRTEAEVALARPMSVEEHRQLLGSVLEECARLTRLTEQLLALAREDAGAAGASTTAVDLAGLVRDVAEAMTPLAEAKGLRVCVVPGGVVEVRGDAARLRQVFFNVVDNAIKYTPEGGTVTVRTGRDARGAVVTVTDTGVGIPPEHLPHVLDRFYRVDKARSREQGGTGLGLSIAQGIVSAHGGRIELESAPGRGTTCTVALPAGHRPADGSPAEQG